MNTNTYVIGTVAVAVAGRWAEDKPLDVRVAVGAAGYAIGLALINTADSGVASKIALAVMLTALFRYVPAIVTKTGIVKADK